MLIRIAGVSLLALSIATGHALADDWVAVKLRGAVQQQVAGEWQPLAKGDVVPDSRSVRTLLGGRVEFVRGEEHIELGPNTLIRIYDRGGDKPFTTVAQAIGTVSIEAKVEQVQHFAVETPYIAAVVKGTKFTVVADRKGSSVTVTRGHVAVEDNHDRSHVTVSAGQSAAVEKDHGLSVAGAGQLPVVLTKDNKPLVQTITATGVEAGVATAAPAVAATGVPVPANADQLPTATLEGQPPGAPEPGQAPGAPPLKGEPGKPSSPPPKGGPGDKGDKPAPGSKPTKGDKPTPPAKPDKPEKPDKPALGDKPAPADKPTPADKPEKADKPDKADKPENEDKPKPSKK